MKSVNIVLAGAAGQGVQSAAAILGKTLMRLGYHVFSTQDYQSRVRGGHNYMRIRFSDERMHASIKRIDFLLAMNEESLHIHLPDLDHDGLAMCMEQDRGDVKDDRLRTLSPDVGPKAAGGAKFVGIKLLAMIFAMIDYKPETLQNAARSYFGRKLKPELLQANLDAVAAVSDSVEAADIQKLPFGAPNREERLLITGNDAIALGMIAGGVGVYVGYPMTPSTGVLNAMAKYGTKAGIAVEQVEDEVAALNTAVGAAYAGARAATGSSGAGISLMSEALGLAGITETPVVIVDGQRAGPSTGMATRSEQSDLLFVVHASQGEFPRAVLAPALHDDAFQISAEAFNIAERWQVPVFIMDDQVFADSECTCPEFDLTRVAIDRGSIAPEPDGPKLLKRYEVTDSGVSPRAFPVISDWIVACDSHEHDEMGHLTDNMENRNSQNSKRMRKLQGMADEFPGPRIIGGPADDLLLCWGSTVGPVIEAARTLRDRGRSVAVAVFRYLHPMNVSRVADALSGYNRLITVEGNYTGQLGKLLRMETGIEIYAHVSKTDGRLFTVEDVIDLLEPVLGGES